MNTLPNFGDESLQLFEHVPLALMLINGHGFIVAINPAACRLFDCINEDVVGKSTIELGIWVEPQERSRWMHILKSVGQLQNRRVCMRSLGGKPLEVLLTVESLNVSGATCFLASYTDITLQESLLDRLRGSQHQHVLNSADVLTASWRLGADMSALFLSERAHLLLDPASTLDQDTGLELQTLVHPEDIHNFRVAVANVDADQKALNLSLRLRTIGGHYRWFRFWSSAPREQGGMEDIHLTKTLEISRLRDAQKALLATSAAHMGTFEIFPDGMAVWDPQMYRLYGHDPGTTMLPHEIFKKVQTSAGYERTSRWLGKSLKYRLSLVIEFEICWPDGQVRWLASKGGYAAASEMTGPSLVGIGWDITDQRKAQMALQKHQQDLSRLTMQLLEQEKLTTSKLALALHDQLGQTLTAARLIVEAQLNVQPTDSGRKVALLMSQAMIQVRNLLMDLRPPMLEEYGLVPALQNEIDRVLTPTDCCDITLDADATNRDRRWPAEVEYAFFMIAREAISNALTHAKANLIQVTLRTSQEGLVMEIIDDGQGFELEAGAGRPGHLGMVGMKERAVAVMAQLSITSLLGDGTRVRVMWAHLA
jgi:PAS domain S-box-containing protein